MPAIGTAENPLAASLERLPVHPTTLHMFGATGDLAQHKLVPALYNLAHEGALPERFNLIGVALDDLTTDEFRTRVATWVKSFSRTPPDDDVLRALLERTHYVSGKFDDHSVYERLIALGRRLDDEAGTPLDRVHYFSTAPVFFDALCTVGQVVLYDSVAMTSVDDGLARAIELSSSFHVVDLAWLRSEPWRERIAMSFDPPAMRPELGRITAVAVRHHPDSAVAGLLLVGWLASRLGRRPGAMVRRTDLMYGRCRGPRQDVAVRLSPAAGQSAPGLAGITIATASGLSLSLDRGPGGLHAVRRTRDGGESSWVVMGASRGEAGILGMGIRAALLRDATYRPAVEAATQMLS